MYPSYKLVFLWRQDSVKWAGVLYFNRILFLSPGSQLPVLRRVRSQLGLLGAFSTLFTVRSDPPLVFAVAVSSLVPHPSLLKESETYILAPVMALTVSLSCKNIWDEVFRKENFSLYQVSACRALPQWVLLSHRNTVYF